MRILGSLALLSCVWAPWALLASPSAATTFVYTAALGPEAPGATGSGSVQIDWDDVAQTMRIQANFSGLSGLTTQAHIHAPTATPGSGTAGVATQLPSFTSFPLGVSAGVFDQTFDLTQATTYNPQFIVDNGGTTAGAEASLKLALDDVKAYFNIHTDAFPSGEIRGFPVLVPEPGTAALLGLGLAALAGAKRRR